MVDAMGCNTAVNERSLHLILPEVFASGSTAAGLMKEIVM